MKKTSVYLPDELKQALAGAAERTGRSEAEFIRVAIEAAVQQATRGVPAPDPPRSRAAGPALVGVGVGPGAADLLTARAVEAIRSADTIAAASISTQAIGRAEAVVRAGLGPVRVVRLPLDIDGSPSQRAVSLEAAALQLIEHLDRREVVAVLTLGDPNVYSVFPLLAAAVLGLRPAVPVRTVPGIMAFQELAARTGTVVGDEHVSVRIVLGGRGGGDRHDDDAAALVLDSVGRPNETLVLYRGGRSVPAIARALQGAGRGAAAVVGELLGLPGERCAGIDDFVDEPASYLATLIAPAAAPSATPAARRA